MIKKISEVRLMLNITVSSLYRYVNDELLSITKEVKHVRKIKNEYMNRLGFNKSIADVNKLIECTENNIEIINENIVVRQETKNLINNLEMAIMKNLPEIWICILEEMTILDNMLIDRKCINLPIFVFDILSKDTNIVKPVAQVMQKNWT